MNHFPMMLKWQRRGSNEIRYEPMPDEIKLQSWLKFMLRGSLIGYHWWLIRMEDDVVLAQSKGYRP